MTEEKKIKVLYISYDGLTDPLGQSQVLAYLKKFPRQNFSLDILSFEKPQVYVSKKENVVNEIKDSAINWYPLKYTKKPPVISTLKDLEAGWKKVKELNKINNYDIVHCRGYIPAILGRKLKNRFGTKFIFDMRGWWVDEKLESGNWSGPGYKIIYHYFKGLEKKFFQESDKTVSLTYAGKNEILNKGWKSDENIGVIPTCVDFDIFKEFNEQIRNQVRSKLDVPTDAKLLIYSGALGGNYQVTDLVTIFKAYKKVFDNAYLLILSKDDPDNFRKAFEEVGTSRLRIKSADFKEVYKYLIASDVGIIFYKMSFSVIGRSPTKLGEYWACGIPVISLKGIGDLDIIIEKYPQGGILVDAFDEKVLEEAFRNKIIQQPDRTVLREYAKDYFDINKGVKFYKDIYISLKGNNDQ